MLKYFETLVDPYVAYEDADVPPTHVWPFLKRYAGPFKKVFILNGVTSFAVAGAEVGLIYYMGYLIDLLGQASPLTFWSEYWLQLVIMAVFVLILRPLVQALDTALISNAIRPNIAALVRWRAHRHVLRQPVGWFESDFAGRVASRVIQTPPSVGDLVFQIFDTMTFTTAYLIGAGLLLSAANPMLLIPLALWAVLYGVLVRWSLKRIRPAARASSAARSRTLGAVVDTYTNIQSVKLFSHSARELNYAYEVLENHRKTYAAEMRIFTTMDAALVALNGVLIVSLVGWALAMWTGETVTVGVVAAAATLALRINAMTGWIMAAVSSFFRALGIIAEGMETIAQPLQLVDVKNAAALELRGGEIQVDGLTHHYGRQTGGLQSVDLRIQAGEKVGLIGRSGAGKSTFVKLLLRLYDPDAGRVLIDGQDIALVQQDSLRAQIGMVQQDTSLLHRSIRDNLLYGRPDATEDQFIAAAKQAEAHDFILDLQDHYGNTGYDAFAGERGVKLSGGQRQRIALARVILKDAPILLLDEATSALDSEVEAQIQKTLYGMMAGKTVIAIAHRLSTIAQMDRIIVLDDGKIAEQGSHSELLAIGGLYAGFWQHQSGGFIGTE